MAIEMVLQTDDSVAANELIDVLVSCGGTVPEELPNGTKRGHFLRSDMWYFFRSDVAAESFPADIPEPGWRPGHTVIFRYSHVNHAENIVDLQNCMQRFIAETRANFVLTFQREQTYMYREAGTIRHLLPLDT
jgi:hypothetical protein